MNITDSILLGIVEGVTEFLPISSTFHLIWAGKLLGMPDTDFTKLFDVVIQGGAILAVIGLYGREVLTNKKIISTLFYSFLPTAVVGFLLHSVIKHMFFEELFFSNFVFILVGFTFFFVERRIAQPARVVNPGKTVQHIGIQSAIIIGLFQACAVMPGVSRAGAVMVGMMLMGYRRDEAAKYSFLLAVPTILAAAGYDLIKMREALTTQSDGYLLLFVGAGVAFATALFSIKWLVSLLKSHTLIPFAIYRVVIGIALLLFTAGIV